MKLNTKLYFSDPGTSEDEIDFSERSSKQVLELVTVELSEGHVHTPNNSLPSGTPNGSVPNMTPSSSCSYLTVDGTDPDKISNKFPDLVEQAQGLETKDVIDEHGHGDSDPDKTAESSTNNGDTPVARDKSPELHSCSPNTFLHTDSEPGKQFSQTGDH